MSVVCVDTNVVIESWSVSECGECKYNYLSVENVEAATWKATIGGASGSRAT